jgi:AmmeMemoRadiSam system protein B
MRASREAEFAAEPVRPAVFAGSAYSNNPRELSSVMSQRIGVAQGAPKTIAIAAPHASPDGGWDTYRAAYQALPARDHAEERIFVVLGTSHYGAPDRFGLTRKPYVTPYGESRTETALVDELLAAAPNAIRLEDYCHAVEHSIEFQIVFLQHVYGPSIRVLPILCGPFVKSVYEGGLPEDNQDVSRFFDAVANLAEREGKRLFWVLGVDMAHMGSRYGDNVVAQAHAGNMLEVKERDSRRIEQLTQGNREAYWDMVQERHDDLKWCGTAPFYTY